MEGEFNNFNINNTNITFSVATNNIAVSDEACADPVYHRQLGTTYSKGKKVGKAITVVGISIAFTAVALSTGSVLTNVFIGKAPEVANQTIVINGNTLNYSFSITKNERKYKTTFLIELNGQKVHELDCSAIQDYSGEYSPVNIGDHCKAYISFTNSLDYYKVIYTNEFDIK